MPKKRKNDPEAAAQAKHDDHIKKLQETKYEVSALTLAQISELLQHLGSIPYFDIAGMLGAEIKTQLPEDVQKEIDAEDAAKEVLKEEEPKPETEKADESV